MKPRLNPFATHRIDNLKYQFVTKNWDAILVDLEQLLYRAAIVGPHGFGKTTFLNELGEILFLKGFSIYPIFINLKNRRLSLAQLKKMVLKINTQTIILFDGADLLDAWYWHILNVLFFKKAKGIVITAHHPTRLPTLFHCQTNIEILDHIIEELNETNDKSFFPLSHTLFKKHQGNIREVLRDLYMECTR